VESPESVTIPAGELLLKMHVVVVSNAVSQFALLFQSPVPAVFFQTAA
jgi:hypothetical protein